MNDGRVELRTVTVGVTNARLDRVARRACRRQQVVARAAAFLRTGDEVRPISAAALDEHREAARSRSSSLEMRLNISAWSIRSPMPAIVTFWCW